MGVEHMIVSLASPSARPRPADHPRPAVRGEAGFSLIEGLVAVGLLLLIAVGVLPLFTQAIINNVEGQSSTDAANFGRSTLEEYFQLPFDSASLDVPAGLDEGVVDDFYTSSLDGDSKPTPPYSWQQVPAAGTRVLWNRTTTVRQYGVPDISGMPSDEAVPLIDAPLPGGTLPGSVHLKEIQVDLASSRQESPLGGGATISLRVLKPF